MSSWRREGVCQHIDIRLIGTNDPHATANVIDVLFDALDAQGKLPCRDSFSLTLSRDFQSSLDAFDGIAVVVQRKFFIEYLEFSWKPPSWRSDSTPSTLIGLRVISNHVLMSLWNRRDNRVWVRFAWLRSSRDMPHLHPRYGTLCFMHLCYQFESLDNRHLIASEQKLGSLGFFA